MNVRQLLASTALAAAYGGSVTSVDGNKQVSTLSPTDQDQLCHDVANYIQVTLSPTDLKKFVCGFTQSSSSDPATCQARFNECMNDPNKNVTYSTMINCTTFNSQLARCSGVTVSQYAECTKQSIDMMRSLASKMPLCDKNALYQAQYEAIQGISRQCIEVFSKCSIGTGGGGAPQ